MTRINLPDPVTLTDQHLLAEYRELPRIFALARPNAKRPTAYTMGTGHVLFFYPLTKWLSNRQAALIAECQRRGFNVNHTTPPAPIPGCDGDWIPTPEAIATNMQRLRERLAQKPGFYTHYGKLVAADFYGTP